MRNSKYKLYIPLDLAAVCSVAFIMLLLYLSASRYKPQEPVKINMPETSGYMCSLNNLGDAVVLIGEGKVFLYLPDTIRKEALAEMGNKYNIHFAAPHIERFKSINFIGMPLVAFDQQVLGSNNAGLNLSGANNELSAWIKTARTKFNSVYKRNMMISIKADKDTAYPLIKKVITILQDQDINKFAFITATKVSNYD